MSMLVPARNRNFFNHFMADPFDAFFSAAPSVQKTTPSLMRTDIRESENGYELAVDLPGFKKEDITAELKDGYLSINAKTQSESEDKDEKGTWLRKERFSGTCKRSFYVGEEVEQADIQAKFDNGVLTVNVPKKQPQPQLEEGHAITIA